jgi:hypothetical protein
MLTPPHPAQEFVFTFQYGDEDGGWGDVGMRLDATGAGGARASVSDLGARKAQAGRGAGGPGRAEGPRASGLGLVLWVGDPGAAIRAGTRPLSNVDRTPALNPGRLPTPGPTTRPCLTAPTLLAGQDGQRQAGQEPGASAG